ncbi:MAG: ATP-binding protein [Bacteroidales bacterium]|nr:ATP-binding protein [Bacteroidales bacterium]
MIIRPLYLDAIKPFIDKPLIKIITGIRRSGKSTILRLLEDELVVRGVRRENILSINFESYANFELLQVSTLYQYINNQIKTSDKFYLLLDEVQEVEDWEKAVNSFLVDFNVDIYITGSNSHLLSSELATYLTGRYVEIPVYTLSYKEFLDFRNHYFSTDQPIVNPFLYYLRKGGFPVIHTADYTEESAYQVVYDIYSSVMLRDTVQRYRIRDVELLERVIMYAFDNIGNTFSGKNVADYFKSQQRKLDINTVYNYLNALEGAFILYRVPRYDIKGREILKTQEKFYVNDISILYATMGYRDRMIGGILENIVFLELKRRGYKVYVGKLGQLEIDFVAEKQGSKIYVQVAYKLENKESIRREFGNLLSINDQYPKYVVTMDEVWRDSIEGVEHLYITDFLLME